MYCGFSVTKSRGSSVAAGPSVLVTSAALFFPNRFSMIGPTLVIWSRPMKASTSGMIPGRSLAKRWDRQPATMIFWRARSSFSARSLTASKIALTDSVFALSMNEQVLMIRTSASSASGVMIIPDCARWPIITSESMRFLAQPREMRPTVVCMAGSGDSRKSGK